MILLVENSVKIEYNENMPNDMYTLKALTDELSFALTGGRIEKINQPEKDEFTFYVHKNKSQILVVSVNPNCPRIHLTNEKKDNPYVAPSFLMLLRKKLAGARIEKISLVGFDRIIKIDFKGKNEMSDEVSNTLYIELMGRYSNVILCSDQGVIIEALRHIYPENSFRCILPKIKYELPQNNKLAPTDSLKIVEVLQKNDLNDISKRIALSVSGFAYSTIREMLCRIGIDYESKDIDEKNAKLIADAISELYSISTTPKYQPCYTFSDNSEDFFVFPYNHQPAEYKTVQSLNDAVRICCTERDRRIRLQQESKTVSTAIKNAIKKAEKSLGIARQKMIDSSDFEKLRVYGEIITNNLYLLKKGVEEAELYNYYDDSLIKIKLDPLLTPEKNAQAYFKRYSKSKRTVSVVGEQIKDLEKKLEYLYSLKSMLEICTQPQEIEGIVLEAYSSGILENKASSKTKTKKTTALPPKEYFIDGFIVYRGRNNIDNEQITFRMSSEKDIWLHVKDLHGSHVLIKNNGKDVPDKVIQTASEIAGFYSEGKQNYKIAVDYCEKKYVKKSPSGVKGAVIYTNYKTAYISPSAHIELEKNK